MCWGKHEIIKFEEFVFDRLSFLSAFGFALCDQHIRVICGLGMPVELYGIKSSTLLVYEMILEVRRLHRVPIARVASGIDTAPYA